MNQCASCSTEIETTRSHKRLCDRCFAEKMRQRARRYYAENRAAIIKRRRREHKCNLCGASFFTQSADSCLCAACAHGKQHVNLGYELFYRGRLALLHRAIAIAILGEEAISGKAVHHLDGNGKNNELSNLIVLESSDHARLHRYTNTQPTTGLGETSLAHLAATGVCFIRLSEVFAGSKEELEGRLQRLKPVPTHRAPSALVSAGAEVKSARTRAIHNRPCDCCGREFRYKPSAPRKYCSYACSHEASKRVTRPSKEELHAMVWEAPTLTVAQKLGVTDKSIEKWCKSYGIDKPPRGYWAKIHAGKAPGSSSPRATTPRIPWQHGTNTGYCKHACRCQLCTEAHKLKARLKRRPGVPLSKERG